MPKLYVIAGHGAGHGAGDPGACANGYQEAERVRALAQRIKDFGGDDVTLHPFSDDAYQSNALSRLSIPSDTCVVELHMDSAGSSARGAHVIIYASFEPDEYDKALASALSAIFPGRSKTIVGRSDLQNPIVAARRGINYRLAENGFISNATDVSIFNDRMDEIAKAYLAAFGIKSNESGRTARSVQTYDANGTDAQKWLFEREGEYYRIKSVCCGKYLNIRGGKINGATPVNVDVADGSKAQLWKVDTLENEGLDCPVRLRSALDERYVLDVVDGGTASGTGLQVRTESGTDWANILTPVWAGESWTYFLLFPRTCKALDVFDAGRSI